MGRHLPMSNPRILLGESLALRSEMVSSLGDHCCSLGPTSWA